MVRSKEVPKKPKDPLLTPPSKPRGFRDDGHGGGSLPRNRGGAAMSPTPASVPNYMRATSSSDAKAGQRARLPLPSASPLRRRPIRVVTRGKVLFPTVAGVSRATCSSTLKEAKFPGALDLAPGATDAEGPVAMRVCPYTYCSLNGHVHAPAVPLRSFLASRRRLIKTQQSMKLKGVSAFRKSTGHQRPEDTDGAGVCAGAATKIAPLIDEEALGDFFVEVYAGPRVSSDMSCSDMSLDEMDATPRKMEFVVFDRCDADGDNKEIDLGVSGDSDGEARHAVCRDSSSECSDSAISSGFVDELPWMRYQGYEYDSLDDDALEEQVVRDDENGGAEMQEGKDDENTSGRLGDECKVVAAKDHDANDEENILILPCDTEIIAEKDDADCRAESHEEASTWQEKQERLSFGVCKLEITEQEEAEMVADILDEGSKEVTSAHQEDKGDDISMESPGKVEITEDLHVKDEVNIPDDGYEMEISEIVSGVGCKEHFFEEVTSKHASEGEICDFGEIGSPDVGIQKQPTDGHVFEEDSTADDVFEQDYNSADIHDNAQKDLDTQMSKFEVASEETGTVEEIDQGNTVSGIKDAYRELEITICNLGIASEDSAIAQESSQDGDSRSECAQMAPECTPCKLEDASEESGTTQEISENGNTSSIEYGVQIEPEITTSKFEDILEESKESGTTQEISKNGNSSSVEDGVQIEPEITTFKFEDILEESDTAQETIHDDNSASLIDCAHMDLGIGREELEDTSEEAGITQETRQDDNSSYASGDAQNDLGIMACKSEGPSEEFVILQEGDISDGTQNESEHATYKSSEEFDVSQEAVQDDKATDVNGCSQKELEITCESEDAHEESDITEEGGRDGYIPGSDTSAEKEMKIIACESEDASEGLAMPQEAIGHVNTMNLSNGDEKELSNACEELCITEETKLSSDVQIPEHTDLSTVAEHREPQNLPAEDTGAKESSIDEICDAFSGMNLKGDVYVDPAEAAVCPRNRLIIARRRRTPEEEEYMRGFNPRAPNFLPPELDPEAEKVDLKHQLMDERKNAEEWMIDYALRRAVNNLGPARKKKVELLVQAFETVLPHEEEDKKSITPSRHVQACN